MLYQKLEQSKSLSTFDLNQKMSLTSYSACYLLQLPDQSHQTQTCRGQGLSVCSQMEIDHLLPAYHFSHQLEIIRIRINKTRRKR